MRSISLCAIAIATTAALTTLTGSVRATTLDAATASLVEAPNIEVQEGTGENRSAILSVTLRYDNAATPQTVDYKILPGTATAGLDYTAIPDGTLVFMPGETTKTLAIPIVADALPECPEGFTVRLQHWFYGPPMDVQVTIRDDDGGDGGVMDCPPAFPVGGSGPLDGGTVEPDASVRGVPMPDDPIDAGVTGVQPEASYPAEGIQGAGSSGCSMNPSRTPTSAGILWLLGALAIVLGLRRRRD
jgi:MYXO-CTERM domain-containing protein